MAETILGIGCKVNLTLTLTGRRSDGYHTLKSLFMPVREPHDVLTVTEAPYATGLSFACDRDDVDPSDNTLTKAYGLFAASTGLAPDISVHLHKGIPSGAGLGGGSADAAALLRHLNTMAGWPLTPVALAAVALRIGADVPFFLQDRPCLAEGIGEILTPRPDILTTLKGRILIICCPQISVSTPWAYKAWDDMAEGRGGTEGGCDVGLTKKPPAGTEHFPYADGTSRFSLPFCVQNDFERVVFPRIPELAVLKRRLLQAGAEQSVMSGSGSSVIGLFTDREAAKSIAKALSRDGVTTFSNVIA